MSPKFESDCLEILKCLDKHGYRSLKHIASCSGISIKDVRRYLLIDAREKRPVEKMFEWREKNFPLYNKLIDDCIFLGDGTVEINTSKYEYLIKTAEMYRYDLKKIREYPYIAVTKLPETYRGSHFEFDDSVSNTSRDWTPLKKH